MVGHAHEKMVCCVIAQTNRSPKASEEVAWHIDRIEILLGKFHRAAVGITIGVRAQCTQGVYKKDEHRDDVPED
jgi:hypothetical protein